MSEFMEGFDNIPSTLKSLMGTLFNTNILNSWNIFENRDGVVVINIRFRQDTLQPSVLHEPIAFRRLSTKQITRNRQRSQLFQNNLHNSQNTLNKKRKLSTASPEINLVESNTAHHFIDTPEAVSFRPLEYDDDNLSEVTIDDTFTRADVTVEYEHVTPECPATLSNDVDKNASATGCESAVTQVSPSPHPPSDYVVLNPLSEPFMPGELSTHVLPSSSDNDNHVTIQCPCCSEIMTATHECVMAPEEDSLGTLDTNEIGPLQSPPVTSLTRPSPKPPDLTEAEKGEALGNRMAQSIAAELSKTHDSCNTQ